MDTSHSSAGGNGGAPGNQEDNWQTEAEAVDTKDDDLREFYQAALEGSKYDSAELQKVHLFASKAQTSLDPRSEFTSPPWPAPLSLLSQLSLSSISKFFPPSLSMSRSVKLKAIMREMKQLEESLPIHPHSAIFLRQVS